MNRIDENLEQEIRNLRKEVIELKEQMQANKRSPVLDYPITLGEFENLPDSKKVVGNRQNAIETEVRRLVQWMKSERES